MLALIEVTTLSLESRSLDSLNFAQCIGLVTDGTDPLCAAKAATLSRGGVSVAGRTCQQCWRGQINDH